MGVSQPQASEADARGARGHAGAGAVPAEGDVVAGPNQEDEEEDDRDFRLPTYSDGGVDVVAWQDFRDGRAGFPVLLAQCTVQEKWRPRRATSASRCGEAGLTSRLDRISSWSFRSPFLSASGGPIGTGSPA